MRRTAIFLSILLHSHPYHHHYHRPISVSIIPLFIGHAHRTTTMTSHRFDHATPPALWSVNHIPEARIYYNHTGTRVTQRTKPWELTRRVEVSEVACHS